MIKIIAYTAFALVAFAFNSILCRMALRTGEADQIGFTAVRLVSGAITLALICAIVRSPIRLTLSRNVDSGIYLFIYAFFFSIAYLDLSAGTGALILFGAVQLTMIGFSIFKGEHPRLIEWIGLIVAVFGLGYLVFPGLTAPPWLGSLMMAGAGVAWGAYSLRGKGAANPLSDTASNFIVATFAVLLVVLSEWREISMTGRGVLLAVLSGAVTSGLGYTVWYAALKHHTATRAAVLQLSVPVIAAFGGVALLAEAMTNRLLIAAALILGGVGLTIAGRQRKN